MKDFLEEFKKMKLNINKDTQKIQQTQRNLINSKARQGFLNMIKEYGLEAFDTADGIAVEIFNEETGAIVVLVNTSMPASDYDAEEEHNSYVIQQEAKRVKKEEVALKKKEKAIRDKANREQAKRMKANKLAQDKAIIASSK